MVDFFKSLIQDKPNIEPVPDYFFPPITTDEENENLIMPPSPGEMKEIIDSIGSLKAPRPDGFSSLFYQHSWDLIHKEGESMGAPFFQNIHDLIHVIHTNVALMPEINNP